MLDFTLTEQQQQLRHAANMFATSVLAGARATYEQYPTQAKRFNSLRPLYSQATKAGLIKGQIPVALGGLAGPLIDAAVLVEEIYHVDPSAALTILGTGLGLTPLILGGTKEQHERFLKPFLSGEGEPLASLVHSEPQGTANWLEKGGKGLQTTARQEGNSWIIDGEKLWTTNSGGWDGKGANLQCVACRVSPDGSPQDPSTNPADSIVVLMVTTEVLAANPPDAYRVLADPELAGHTAASGPHSRFTNLRVPAENVLAAPDAGAQLIQQTFAASAAIVGAMAVSIMRSAFEAAMKFAKTDNRGGSVPILERQSVADLLIDIKMRIETSRLLTWKALHCLENGPGDCSSRLELALEAKIFASENAVKSCVDAMKAVGMTSYAKDQPFARLLNDAVCLPLFDGGNVGIRRRQIEKVFLQDGYQPWAATYGPSTPGDVPSIDGATNGGLKGLAEVDVGTRQNAHKPLRELGTMGLAVLRALERGNSRSVDIRGKMFLPWDNKFATIDTTERPPIIIYRKEPGNTGTSMSGNMNNTPIYPTPPFVLVDGVRMFRDLGGYTAGTNRKVHRGLVFRSGDLSSMTFRGKDELTKLGIEKVFDLRSPISIDSHIIHGQEAEIDKRKDGGMTTPTEGLALADPRDPERILVDAVI